MKICELVSLAIFGVFIVGGLVVAMINESHTKQEEIRKKMYDSCVKENSDYLCYIRIYGEKK